MEKEIITAIYNYLKEQLLNSDYYIAPIDAPENQHGKYTIIVVCYTFECWKHHPASKYTVERLEIMVHEDMIRTSSYYNNSYSPAGCFEICDPDLLSKIKDMIVNRKHGNQ